MPLSALTGTRLRERRLASGLRQADVAVAAGISASYLNLIEHNRRKVTPEVAERLSGVLGLDLGVLSGGLEAAVLDGLRSAAGRSLAAQAEMDRLEEFVGRFPGWAGLVAELEGRLQGLERAVAALNDRMTHDPHLSQALHELLSSLSSVRATASILAETPDLPSDWADRFHRNLHDDSERLATGAEALVAYLDAGSAIAEQGIASPQEEVEDWLARRGWAIPDLTLAEDPAGDLAGEVALLASSAARRLAATQLRRAAADAIALPAPVLLEAVAKDGPDPLAIAERLRLLPMLVLRRLAAMPDLGAGLVVCDGSGTLTFRKPAAGFPLPRFGAACPLWPLYTALGRPLQPVDAMLSVSGDGARIFRAVAWCEVNHPEGPRGPELREAAMLVLPVNAAPSKVLTVGSNCRVCPKSGCPGRREPSILSEGGHA
jgi:transcriptional regulator with XRE-family HTH domain